MPLARKIGLAIAGTSLVFFLFATAIDIGVVRTFGSPEPTKRVLKDSGIYNSIVSSSLDQAKEISGSNSEIPLGNQAVRDAAISIFDAQFLQTTSNNVIDSVYRWLDGRTPVPDFKIDLTAKKAEFADKVAAAAKDRAATLPRCPTAATGNIDAFNATCLPPGLTPEQVAATVHNDIMTGTGFLEKPVLTAADVKSQNTNKPVFSDQLKDTPRAYQKFKSTPWIFAFITLLALVAVIFLSESRLKGLKHAGLVLVASGAFLVIFTLAVNTALNNKILPKIKLNNAVEQASIRKLVRDSVHKLDGSFWIIGIVYVFLGAIAVGSYYYLIKRQPGLEPIADNPDPPKDSLYKPVQTAKKKPKAK